MGFQFAHLSTFAAQVSTKRRTAGGLTVRDVLAEAGREPSDCPHVHRPALPVVLYGQSPAEALMEHDRRCAEAKRRMRGAGRGRGLRRDTHTLAVEVMSHPTPCAELIDPAARAEYEAWRADALAWARKDLERQGIEVLGAVEHLDERFPHLHVYGVPLDLTAFDARLGHPGHQAARSAPTSGAGSAYREAMRSWQDDYHLAVGVVHGLTRLGPARRRLPRAEWKREQAAARAAARALRRAQDASKAAAAMEARATERDRSTALLERQAATLRDAAAADRGAALNERAALSMGVDAWAAGEVVDVRPAAGGQLGLVFARGVPESRRHELVEALAPAWDAVCRVLCQLTEIVQTIPAAARVATRVALAERWGERTRGARSR